MTFPAAEAAMQIATSGILSMIGASLTLSSALTNKGYIYSAYVSTLIVDGLNQSRQVFNKPTIENPRGGLFISPWGDPKFTTPHYPGLSLGQAREIGEFTYAVSVQGFLKWNTI
jgi:hypothetical protein